VIDKAINDIKNENVWYLCTPSIGEMQYTVYWLLSYRRHTKLLLYILWCTLWNLVLCQNLVTLPGFIVMTKLWRGYTEFTVKALDK